MDGTSKSAKTYANSQQPKPKTSRTLSDFVKQR